MNRVIEVTEEMISLAMGAFMDTQDYDLADAPYGYIGNEAIRAALTAVLPMLTEQAGVPDGWKLVPVEPTNEMYLSACHAYAEWNAEASLEKSASSFTHNDTYRSMLSAAPQHEVTK